MERLVKRSVTLRYISGEVLLKRREEAGLSQGQLADRMAILGAAELNYARVISRAESQAETAVEEETKRLLDKALKGDLG